MKLRGRRDLFVSLVIYATITIMYMPLYPLFQGKINLGGIAMLLFILAVSALLLCVLHGTSYTVDQKQYTYKSGPIKGKVEIEKINTVIIGKNLFIGLRPATALKGIIIKYGRYDDIYFSPDSNETFIAELLKFNPGIKVERH